MTDLERVREVLEYYGFPDLMVAWDAHLKEDAEREAQHKWEKAGLKNEWDRCEAELTALRERFEETEDSRREARNELAELREDRDRLKSNLLTLDTAVVKRYDALREAVRAWALANDDYGPVWRLLRLIEANATKEA